MLKKMIIVHQQSIKDCGPCCLKSIIEYYDGYVPFNKLKEDCFTTNEGTTVFHITKAAQKYGFDAIARKNIDIDNLELALPLIVHVKYENGLLHYMVLYKIKNNRIILMDPAKGKIILSKEEFLKIFTGIVIELIPKNIIISMPKEKSIYKLFLSIIKTNKKLIIFLIITSILSYALIVLYSFYFKVLNNSYVMQKDFSIIKYEIYLFLIIFLLKQIMLFYKKYFTNCLEKNIDVGTFKNFIEHIFKIPLNVICTKQSGEIISRIEDLGMIKSLFSEILVTGGLDTLLSFITLFALLSLNKVLTAIILITAIIYIILSLVLNPYLYQRLKKNLDLQTNTNVKILEQINMIYSIKNLNAEENSNKILESNISNLIYDNYEFNNEYNSINFFQNFICEFGVYILNIVGFYLIYIGKLSLINLVIFNTLLTYFLDPIKNIINLFFKYNYLRASFNKICDFINIEEEKIESDEQFINGNITFENIGFSYNKYNNNFSKYNLCIKENEKILLKGRSGSGKSTLCNLLRRIYDVDEGRILIGDKNIQDYSLSTIRKNIIYVGQKENVYTDTIKNNIVFNRNEKDFNKVCDICFIENIVNKKPFRFDSGIDNNSANLSGGEKQRIILARSLLQPFEILILDEALSEVDYYQEKLIIKNLLTNYANKTIIYISHKKHDELFERSINIDMRKEHDL